MPKGYAGKVLRVNLTDGSISTETPSDAFYRRYLGGQGFVAHWLLTEVPKNADPLGPENVLIFAAGTTTGIPVSGGGRSAMGAKSPLTGFYGEADVGGFFGAEMVVAGYDAILVYGKAPHPVYLWINKGKVEIRPAGHLWGTTTLDCQKAVREELGDQHIRLAMIGPGGEKMDCIACVINDVKHAAGRTGLGAVMGSKNLKAVAARGAGAVPVADPDGVKALARWMRDNWENDASGLHKNGTADGVMSLHEAGQLPTRNFQDGQFEGAEKVWGETMSNTILVDRGSCWSCAIHCKRVVDVNEEGYSAVPEYGGPEYETIGSMGSNCGIDDLRAISAGNELANAYGLDSIAAGMMVSFAMECYEAGLITKKDTGGLDLHFGNGKAMVELIRQMGERTGFGAVLADGPKPAIAKIGPESEEFAMHVKGQPFPMHECRTRHGQALGYAVSPTGADHMHNFWDGGLDKDPVGEELQSFGMYERVPQTVLNGQKVRAYTHMTNWTWVDNHLGMCAFIPWSVDQTVALVNAITGWKTNVYELELAAQRGLTLARIFNMREGMTRADDSLPARMNTPFKTKSVNEKPVTPESLQEAISSFYGMMGWDTETGVPTKATLQQLDIEWAGAHLPK
jgi:aldehyde:ferredoxin oxidoreductase